MFKQRILEDLKKAVENLGFPSTDIVLSIPKNADFGDYSSNIALQLANQKLENGKQSPGDIAKKISEQLEKLDYLEKVEVAGAGFINFFIKPEALLQSLHQICDYSTLVNPKVELENVESKKTMVEFTDPNPFKEFHIGHLFSNSVGESLSRLFEAMGAEVKRVNYFGDVGMHVAKSIWGMRKKIKNQKSKVKIDEALNELEKQPLSQRMKFLGEAYALGSTAYDENEKAQEEIKQINILIYKIAQDYIKENDQESDQKESKEIGKLYAKGRQWSLEYFETIYAQVGTKFDDYYPESAVAEYGIKIVKEHLDDGVFKESEGAIIFPGEKYGLHNRVFINSLGLPTYEAKELGLAVKKYQDWEYDQSIVITGNEINDYFKVLMMALSQIYPELARKTTHIGHGMLRMTEGKISSRKGNALTFEELIELVRNKVEKLMKDSLTKEEREQVINMVSIGAIKFAMLKHQPSADITFDVDKSVALEGDSGPYIQYSYGRAKSVLRNAQYDYNVELPHSEAHPQTISGHLEKEERLLLQKIEHFESNVAEAAESLHPNILASYLLEMASLFNLFYQKHPIIKSDKSELRLALTCAVAIILKQGLYLLGIEAPERM